MILKALLLVLFSLIPVLAKADCESFRPWREALARPSSTPAERADQDTAEYLARERLANEIYTDYRQNRGDLTQIEKCLVQIPDRANFLSTVQRVFFDNTLNALARSNRPTLRRLMALLQTSPTNSNQMVFRLTGHFDGLHRMDKKAGFHRATKSIFMDVSQIPANEWPIVFVHEVLHALDQDLYTATETFSQQDRIVNFDAGSPRSQEWLIAGLDRGLLGEYRAWYFTLAIYREGLEEGLWTKIPWMEQLIAPKGSAQDQFLFAFLDPRFSDPVDGPFSQPKVAAALAQLRARLRISGAPELGSLGQLFQVPTL